MENKVLYFFEEINKIPRGSGNEKAVSDFLVDFAKERNLFVIQDKANNVIIKKGGSLGYENSPTVVIQGHMDMVCEKNHDTVHDFLKDPIKVIYEGDFIHADGTTLGADDGIAVAFAMAILDDNSLSHPPIEVVITTDEEVGMIGAGSLDEKNIEGRILLNIDSEEEGILTVGCAGGRKTHTDIEVEYEKSPYENYVKIIISGLLGGHSGIDIDKYRANANIIAARCAKYVLDNTNSRLCDIHGGAKDNAIPREAQIIVSCEDIEKVKEIVDEFEAIIKREYIDTDKNISIRCEEITDSSLVFTEKSVDNVINFITLCPNGILSMNMDLKMAESSNNIGVVSHKKGKVEVVCAVRSELKSKKDLIFNNILSLGKLCGGNTTFIGDYPAWVYNPNSKLRDLMISVYENMYGSKPKVETVHAGLECGLISEKIPDMDMVSYGPNLYDIHTPKEKASISSINRVYNYTLKILESIK
ncbi:MAG: aminoacyl-histidine dipeptidase [Lachnospirales bacterium]